MAANNVLTTNEIEQRLTAARERERRARIAVAKLRRQIVSVSRRVENQRKYCLGGVAFALSSSDDERDRIVVERIRDYLLKNPPHDSNQKALFCTPFDVFGG